jgi:Amidase
VDRAYGGRDTMSWTAAASLAGLPALSLPCGLTRAGLPIGVQLMAARGADIDLLRLAQRLESAGVVGGHEAPETPSIPDGDVRGPMPVEAPPSVSAANAEVAAVRVAARAIGLPDLDGPMAEGAAQTLQAVREALRRGSCV